MTSFENDVRIRDRKTGLPDLKSSENKMPIFLSESKGAHPWVKGGGRVPNNLPGIFSRPKSGQDINLNNFG